MNINIKHFENKAGIEIGGPSTLFETFLPIYEAAKKIDGINYSEEILWDNPKKGAGNFSYGKGRKGDQYILEATNLSEIPKNKYDFLLASHCLEHIANPMKALHEWMRVVKPGGRLVVIVPHKYECFDHNREVTLLDHILDDFYRDTQEDDLTHLEEILEKHDLEMDKAAGTFEQFKQRSLDNKKHRALHHHVFSINLLVDLFKHVGLTVEFADREGLNIVCIGRKKPSFITRAIEKLCS